MNKNLSKNIKYYYILLSLERHLTKKSSSWVGILNAVGPGGGSFNEPTVLSPNS